MSELCEECGQPLARHRRNPYGFGCLVETEECQRINECERAIGLVQQVHKLTAQEREHFLRTEGPMALFSRLLAEAASRKPDGWEHAARMFAFVAGDMPARIELGEAFRLERVLFAFDVRHVSPSAHDGSRFLPFDLPGCEFSESQRVTHLLISARKGDTIRGGAFGYVPNGRL